MTTPNFTQTKQMRFFLDTANIEEIESRYDTGLIDGVTTNPTLILKSGRTQQDVIKEIAQRYPAMESISAEVVAETADEMIAQAETYYPISPAVTIKVPCTVEGLKACKRLSDNGIPTNVTLVFSVAQACLAMKAGATYLSPFVGRLNDNSFSGVELIKAICGVQKEHKMETKILAASIREAHQASRCLLYGAHVLTLPPKTFDNMYKSVLTREGLDLFNRDYAEASLNV
jgi:transaldolase|tara:strand:- start:3288 stop:3977 length:690 start_codon:yes stop_codon:yes gene_type:complete